MTVEPAAPLPPLYDQWMRQRLGLELPNETEATCADCAMCSPDARTPGAYFHRGAKCCTYHPTLPNFLVGRVLADPDAGARAIVEQRIAERRDASPLGLHAPADYPRAYEAHKARGGFGRDPDMVCPYYLPRDGGLCGIWRHRNAICSTWFCKHVRGATAKRFWQRLATLLALAENSLARWCIAELELGAPALHQLFPGLTPSAAEIDPTDPTIWGPWAGREAELYLACAERVAALSWQDVQRICGPELRITETVLDARAAALHATALPERVELGSMIVHELTDDHVRIETYSPYDALDVPRVLFDALHRLSQGELEQARAAIAADLDLDLEPELLLQLLDFDVLRPAT